MGLESSIERKLVAKAKSLGIASYKFSSPSRAGVPDRIFIHEGRVLFLEIKAPNKEPTALQMDEMGLIKAAGGIVTWVDDYEEGVTILENLNTHLFKSMLRLNQFRYDRHLL